MRPKTILFDWRPILMKVSVYPRNDDYDDVLIRFDLGELGIAKVRIDEDTARSLMEQIEMRLEPKETEDGD